VHFYEGAARVAAPLWENASTASVRPPEGVSRNACKAHLCYF
jgi:hypothetical protein